jgi:hypothetical protein
MLLTHSLKLFEIYFTWHPAEQEAELKTAARFMVHAQAAL